MYNVLHILTGDDGGISAIVKDYYKYIDREAFHFDIACTTETEGNDIATIKALGAEVIHLPLKSSGIKEYTDSLNNVLKNKPYDAVHVHENETSYIALGVAKRNGIKCRIAHSHTTAPYTTIKNELRRLSGIIFNYKYATTVIGCGRMAGERVFGKYNMNRKKAVVLSNAIDSKKFEFDNQVRSEVRANLGISNEFVVGFVGRLSPEKNPFFCLRIMEELIKINVNAVLIMAGDGSCEGALRQYVHDKKLEKHVRLLGKRTDAHRLYQAFDAFVLPSLHEGFPLVAVEALASGLPVFLSSKITDEFSFSKNVTYLGISNVEDWVDAVSSVVENCSRNERSNELDCSTFDIKYVVKKLEKIYLTP